MLRLDTTTTKLQALLAGAVATNALPVYVAYSDQATAYTGGKQVSTLSGTSAVDLCSAPAASTVRDIDYMSITNADTAAVTVTVRINDGGTLVTLYTCTLEIGERLEYVHGAGFRAMTSAGATKSGSVQDLSGYQQITGKDASGGYAGLTGFAINFKNLLGTIVSLFQNANTAIRTYTWPDKSGTVAMTSDVVTDHTALSNIGTNTHAQIDTALTRLASTSGSNTGDQDLSSYATTAAVAAGYQPLDSDLTAIAALTTTTYGRAFLALADAPAGRTALALGSAAVASLDLDGTMAANSDGAVPSQKAIRTYVANKLVGMLDLRGTTDCSASPNYPSASKGDAYYVSVAGKIGGASGKSVDAADFYVALADNAGGTEASVGTSWFVLEHNLIGALLASNNLSDVGNAGTALANIGGVPTTRTVNGQALSSNVTVSTITGNAGTATALATSRNIDGQAFDGTANITVIAPGTHAATGKTTPVDADELPISDSAASNVLKKLTWANLKATLKTYLDTLYQTILVSGTSIKTINSTSLLGSGDIAISGMNLTANTFTGAQEVDLAVTTSSVVGAYLKTTSAATVGNQSRSPALDLEGSGWKTNATAGAQSVVFRQEVQPVQGTANPTGKLSWQSNVNGAGFTERASVDTSGNLTGSRVYTGSTFEFAAGLTGFGMAYVPGVGGNGLGPSNAGPKWMLGITVNDGLHLASGAGVYWESTSSISNSNTLTAGIERLASGLLGVNNGTPGTPADLSLRGLKYGSYLTVGTLPSAAASEGFEYEVNDASAPSAGSTVSAGGSAKCKVRSNASNWIVLQVF